MLNVNVSLNKQYWDWQQRMGHKRKWHSLESAKRVIWQLDIAMNAHTIYASLIVVFDTIQV